MKFFPCLIITTCITLCSNNVFGATSPTFSQCASGAVAGSKRCAQVFSGQQPYNTSVSGGFTTTLWVDTPVCCKQWTKDTDTECECKSENRLSGGTAADTKTCNICGSNTSLSYSPGTGTTTGGGTSTVKSETCTASKCTKDSITLNGTYYCFGKTTTCGGYSTNATGCGQFFANCYNGAGYDGNNITAPTGCSDGSHRHGQFCIKNCSAGQYGTTSSCEKCPQFYSPTDNTASGKYGTTSAANSAIDDCFMAANTTATDGIGTYKITSKCSYQQ